MLIIFFALLLCSHPPRDIAQALDRSTGGGEDSELSALAMEDGSARSTRMSPAGEMYAPPHPCRGI